MKRSFLYVALALALQACHKDKDTILTTDVPNAADIYPAPPARWFGGDHPYYVAAGYVGDVMPYYDKDSFHVFYLHDARNGASGFHPWAKFTTQHFTSYDYKGTMIPYGGTADYDLALGTGSIVKVGDTYYAYYSGFNPNFNGTGGKYRDNTLLATSKDLNTWTKDASFLMRPETTNGYNFWEYRDPYVFFNTETNEYWMLVCGHKDDKAAVILYTTNDPAKGNWTLKDPLYTTTGYYVPETPQLFKWGSFWYLLFSENSVENTTRYRIATSSKGPWTTPANDKLDGQYMYSSKVATDGKNTYLFGWCATKGGSTDAGTRDFGGNLVVHQLSQNSDGTLNIGVPENVANAFAQNRALNVTLKQQSIDISGNNVSFKAANDVAYLLYDRLAGETKITATVNVQEGAACGLVFGMDKALQSTGFYKIDFSSSNDLLSGISPAGVDGKVTLHLEPGKDYQLKVLIAGSVCVVYVDDKVALTSRIYAANNNYWGLYASKAAVSFKNVQLFKL